MGQKCNPTGLRIGVIKNWDSRWYAKKGEFADTLVEDYNLRKYLLKTLYSAGVPKGANYFCNTKNHNTEYCRHSKQICPVAQYGG